MIASFGNKTAEDIFHGRNTRDARRLPQQLWSPAQRKLDLINAAHDLRDLGVPPGNRLEKLSGDRQGQHSIRINDQFRICFVWKDGNAEHLEIVDYH